MPQLFRRKGAEILVNGETSGIQSAAHVAVLPGAGFVVVWSDTSGLGGDASESAVKGQRFDADGNKLGGEFLVNSALDGFQGQSKVAALDAGRFVVTWSNLNTSPGGNDNDGPDSGIKGQVFNADGTKAGAEFLVNTSAPDLQLAPSITALASGNFVISWSDLSGLGGDPNSSIKMQMFDATGARIGGELLVNTVTAGGQGSAAIAALSAGGFAVAWTGGGQIKCQLFDAAGVKVGSEQQVSADPPATFTTPSMAPLGAGFVIAWAHKDGTGDADGFDISAQLFDAAGAKIGVEFQVNRAAAGDQRITDVAQLPGGGFLVTWQGPGTNGSGIDLHGQFFTAAGLKEGTEFIVNGVTAGDQTGPKIAALPSGDIVIVSSDNSGIGGDSDGFAVKAQILTVSTDPPSDIALSNATVSETMIDNFAVATLTAAGALNSSFTYEIVSDASGGAFRIDGDMLIVDDNALLDFETQPSIDIRVRATDLNGQSYEETMTVTVADAAIEARYAAGSAFMVNVDTEGFNGVLSMTPLASGGFLAVTNWFAIGVGEGVRGRFFDGAGSPVGGEFDLSLHDARSGSRVESGAFASGGFVLVYEGNSIQIGNGNGFPIRAQRFDAAGHPIGSDILVSTTNNDILMDQSVAVLGSGHFVVTWTLHHDEITGDSTGSQIVAQLFDAAGARIGGEFRVNSGVEGGQGVSHVVALPNGGFVVTWDDSHIEGIKGQYFDAAGNKVGGELTILADSPDYMDSKLAALPSGGFVVSWADKVFEDDVNLFAIDGQIVGADGVNVGGPVLLAGAASTGFGIDHHLAALPGGGFVITWSSISVATLNPDDEDSWAQILDPTGAPVGDPFIVSEAVGDSEDAASVIVLASGALAFAWSHLFIENGSYTSDIDGRIFTPKDVAGPTEGPDVLYGTVAADTIHALGGNDIVSSFAGDDLLDGGGGADRLSGGLGNDVYYVDNGGDVVVEASGEGRDVVYATASYALNGGASVEVLSTASLSGTDAINLTGNALAQEIYGNAGANILNGGGGADLLIGLGGDDQYFITSGSEQIIETAGNGRDVVYAAVSHALGAGVSIEVLSTTSNVGTASINLTGNALAQEIYGNAGANILNGGGGADLLIGLGGDDQYFVTSGSEQIIEQAGQGRDVVYAAVSHALGAGVSIEVLSTTSNVGTASINLTGNELAQEIYGNAGANILNGGGGADLLIGLGGDDQYFITSGSEQIIEQAGQGRDVVYAAVSHALGAGVSIEVLSTTSNVGTASINLTGNELAQEIYGNAGANILNGGGGADLLIGLGGDDQYFITSGSEQIIEQAGQGRDVVYAAVSHTLGAGVSIEVLSTTSNVGTASINLTGNELAQEIDGNAGSNILNGGGGADVLVGLGGDDQYFITSGSEQIVESAGQGRDVAYATVSYVLGAGVSVEVLSTASLGGTSAIDLTGNALAQEIYGNAGANILNGGGGSDYLQGLGGADSFAFTTALGAGNVDTIADMVSGSDRILLDDAVFTGLSLGSVNASAFVVGGAAQDADDRIIYDQTTGALSYDADGNGGGAAVQFAILQGHPALTAGDFTVI